MVCAFKSHSLISPKFLESLAHGTHPLNFIFVDTEVSPVITCALESTPRKILPFSEYGVPFFLCHWIHPFCFSLSVL